jgi:glutamate carboxypeptidase
MPVAANPLSTEDRRHANAPLRATRHRLAAAAALVLARRHAGGGRARSRRARARRQEQQPLLDTLRDLVSIESGSKDLEGLDKIAALIAERLRQLGGKVTVVPPSDVFRMDDTPAKTGAMVQAEWQGTGKKKVLLIAHMDTVYLRGMLKDQPFRVDGNRAYGLGIADDKQGVALILHIVAMLNKLGFKDYGTLTVLVNGDEEISSPGSRSTITRVAADQDAVLSFEGGGSDGGIRLATSGIGSAYLTVEASRRMPARARARHQRALRALAPDPADARPVAGRQGVEAELDGLAGGHQSQRHPAAASAQADARALRVSDFDQLQSALQERIKKKLLPDSKVQVKFEVRRPPLEATPASRALAAHARTIYDEIGQPMKVADVATGGGTDAAFAALKARGAVIEGFGLSGFGAHSNDAEYVQLETIVPRLYLGTRLIMDIARDKAK